MQIEDFKEYEVYSQLKIPKGVPFFIRCDGRGFHKISEKLNLQKPYDKKFIKIMVESAKEVFNSGFQVDLAYVFSDEINLLFTREEAFNRRLEKFVSIIPSVISSKFTLLALKILGIECVVSFDARVIPLPKEKIRGYLIWRQKECFRNCLNSYAFYTLLKTGLTREQAARKLKGLKAHDLHELLFKIGKININNVPAWQRRGVLVYWEKYVKEGYDPIAKKEVKVVRRRIVENWDLPLFTTPEGQVFLDRLLSA